MVDTKKSLFNLYPSHMEVPVLIAGSVTALVFGLQLPVITMQQFVFWKEAFSVLRGVQNLFQEKQYALALIIFIFSVIFPTVKLLSLGAVWFCRWSDADRIKALEWISKLGKWSMVDVFVLAVMQIESLAKKHAQIV